MSNSKTVTIKVSIDFKASSLDWENIESSLGYLSKKVTSYRVNPEMTSIEVDCAQEHQDEINEKLHTLLQKLRPASDELDTHVLFDQSQIPVTFSEDVFSELLQTREVIKHANGIYSLHGRAYKLYKLLDSRLQNLARSFQAEEALYPVTIGFDALHKINFFAAYPHFANFLTTVQEEQENISEFSKAMKSNQEFSECLNTPHGMCRSAGCLHSYPSYAEQTLKDDWQICHTMIGRIFRNESSNAVSLERLNEFSMRELIFMGSQEYVNEGLTKLLDWSINLMKEYGLRGKIQAANDPFFADNLAALQFFQRSQQSKSEMRWINPFNSKEVSVASFNNHTTHFSKSYNIKFESGGYVSTGCVGFGLERMLFLLMAQFGLDEQHWPDLMTS